MRRLLLFAKRPRRGRVKTRLQGAVGPERLEHLYRAFLEDQIRFILSLRGRFDPELCYDGPPRAGRDPRPEGLRISQQGEGDLGQRLLRAFERCAVEGARATLIIGADAPTLPLDRLEEAYEALEQGADVALAPADDGGYVLVGLVRPWPILFRDVSWGSPSVYRETVDRAAEAGLALHRVRSWYDVDDEASLRRLENDLRAPAAALRAPSTARFLSVGPSRRGR